MTSGQRPLAPPPDLWRGRQRQTAENSVNRAVFVDARVVRIMPLVGTMNDTEVLQPPRSISDVMRRAVISSEVRGAIGAAIVTIAAVNDTLEQLESAGAEHTRVREDLLAALRRALASVPDIEVKGIALGGLRGEERLVVDMETLSAALWDDPQAVSGLSEGLSAALAGDIDDEAAAMAAAAEPPPLGPDGFHCARVMAQMQVIDALPSTSRHRLELLV